MLSCIPSTHIFSCTIYVYPYTGILKVFVSTTPVEGGGSIMRVRTFVNRDVWFVKAIAWLVAGIYMCVSYTYTITHTCTYVIMLTCMLTYVCVCYVFMLMYVYLFYVGTSASQLAADISIMTNKIRLAKPFLQVIYRMYITIRVCTCVCLYVRSCACVTVCHAYMYILTLLYCYSPLMAPLLVRMVGLNNFIRRVQIHWIQSHTV